MEVVDEDDPRTRDLEQALDVARRHVPDRRLRPRRARRARAAASSSQPENAASRAIAATAPAHSRARSGGASSVNRSRRAIAPESVPCSSAMAWARARPNRYGSRAPYETLSTQVHDEPGRRRERREIGHEPRLAHAGLALDDDRRAALRRHGVEQRPQPGPLLLAPDELSDRRPPRLEPGLAEQSGHADRPGLAAQQLRPAILDLESLAGRPERRLVEEDLARLGDAPGSARRSSPPGRSATSRARRRRAARRRPRRLRSRSGPGAARSRSTSATCASASRIARAQWAARSASSSWPFGQPNTANTASPMNFSRVPSNASIASTIAMERLVDLAADVFRIVLGDEPDVIDEIGEERRDDAPVAPLDVSWRFGAARRPGPRHRPAASRTGRRTWPHVESRRHTSRSAPGDLLSVLPSRSFPAGKSIPD